MAKKILKGKVVSDKMQKTVVVEVKRLVYHPKYKKRYFVSKKYKAHDGENKHKEGDEVMIEETGPTSKGKKWEVISRVEINANNANNAGKGSSTKNNKAK